MRYRVYWQTMPTPGATFYKGSEVIDFEGEEGSEKEAEKIIQKSIWMNFREYSLDHIQIINVEVA